MGCTHTHTPFWSRCGLVLAKSTSHSKLNAILSAVQALFDVQSAGKSRPTGNVTNVPAGHMVG